MLKKTTNWWFFIAYNPMKINYDGSAKNREYFSKTEFFF